MHTFPPNIIRGNANTGLDPFFASNYHWVRVKKLRKEFAIGVSVRLMLGVAIFSSMDKSKSKRLSNKSFCNFIENSI